MRSFHPMATPISEYRPTSAVARTVASPRGKGHLHPATHLRWIQRGIERSDGVRIRLEGRKIGQGWYTSEAALERFMAELNGAPPEAPARTSAHHNRAAERAGKQLENMGV
jgi:hypothetical protein